MSGWGVCHTLLPPHVHLWPTVKKISIYVLYTEIIFSSLEGRAKQKSDYFECVKMAKEKFDFDNILVMEDDSLPTPSSIQNILNVLKRKLAKRNDYWFMAKFFYSLKFQGFELKLLSILELLVVSAITALPLHWIQRKLFGWKSRFCPKKYSFLPWFVLTVLGFHCIGRQHTILAVQSILSPFRIQAAHAG